MENVISVLNFLQANNLCIYLWIVSLFVLFILFVDCFLDGKYGDKYIEVSIKAMLVLFFLCVATHTIKANDTQPNDRMVLSYAVKCGSLGQPNTAVVEVWDVKGVTSINVLYTSYKLNHTVSVVQVEDKTEYRITFSNGIKKTIIQ